MQTLTHTPVPEILQVDLLLDRCPILQVRRLRGVKQPLGWWTYQIKPNCGPNPPKSANSTKMTKRATNEQNFRKLPKLVTQMSSSKYFSKNTQKYFEWCSKNLRKWIPRVLKHLPLCFYDCSQNIFAQQKTKNRAWHKCEAGRPNTIFLPFWTYNKRQPNGCNKLSDLLDVLIITGAWLRRWRWFCAFTKSFKNLFIS